MKHSSQAEAGNLSLCCDELLCSGIVSLALGEVWSYESVNIKINEQWRGVEYNEAVKIEIISLSQSDLL